MQTIFYSTANIVSRPGKIVDLAEYRRSAARERTAVPTLPREPWGESEQGGEAPQPVSPRQAAEALPRRILIKVLHRDVMTCTHGLSDASLVTPWDQVPSGAK